jgi:hypothetical protein
MIFEPFQKLILNFTSIRNFGAFAAFTPHKPGQENALKARTVIPGLAARRR